MWKTEGLKKAIEKYEFDACFGGARRDEESSRSKERVFSFRNSKHAWDPKKQRPEVWSLYNTRKTKGETIRIFPLSNWTEMDVWDYVYREKILLVPLYFAAPRPTIKRDGLILMVDDDRMPISKDEKIIMKSIRFRTLGCYPLTGAIESKAVNIKEVITEILQLKTSERQGRKLILKINPL